MLIQSSSHPINQSSMLDIYQIFTNKRVVMSPKRRICMDPPQRSNPTTPDASLLLAEGVNLSAREECIELCYRMETFSDVTFRVGNPTTGPFKIYKLHRLVLGGQSSYLYNLCVKHTDQSETIDLADIQPYIFDHIVKWLYKAKLSDKTEDMAIIAKIYEVATALKIKELETRCLDTLIMILDREKKREAKGEASILDEMLVKPAQQQQQQQASDTKPFQSIETRPIHLAEINAPVEPMPLMRSNTEGTTSTFRRESRTKEFFKGVMDKVTARDKDPSKEKETGTVSSLSSAFLNRAKFTVRGGQRSVSHPIKTSMISGPFAPAHLVSMPFSQDIGVMPSIPGVQDSGKLTINAEAPGTPKAGSKGSPYRNSSAF
ncbi:hypothetical protein TWF718_005334 [Orbilia javanica]|uniref:BTB domain-containing protein n=1 Tax=Orbilia javanica TaxID=47235 RepID=A0AAN8MPS7_9PEZI